MGNKKLLLSKEGLKEVERRLRAANDNIGNQIKVHLGELEGLDSNNFLDGEFLTPLRQVLVDMDTWKIQLNAAIDKVIFELGLAVTTGTTLDDDFRNRLGAIREGLGSPSNSSVNGENNVFNVPNDIKGLKGNINKINNSSAPGHTEGRIHGTDVASVSAAGRADGIREVGNSDFGLGPAKK